VCYFHPSADFSWGDFVMWLEGAKDVELECAVLATVKLLQVAAFAIILMGECSTGEGR